jgi:hypothetical protein
MMLRVHRALLACVLVGCAGTETGNPSFEGQLAYDAYSSDVSVAALSDRPDATPLRVESTWLVLGDVHFIAEGACDAAQDEAVHATGIGPGDHAAAGHVSTALTLTEGLYCGVRLPLERAASASSSAPEALSAHSMLIEGVLANGTPVSLRSARQEAVILRAPEPFALSAEQDSVVLGFDVATWLRDVDWSAAERESDGSIRVDSDRNVALLSAFEAALLDGIALFADPSGAAAIDPAQKLAGGR